MCNEKQDSYHISIADWIHILNDDIRVFNSIQPLLSFFTIMLVLLSIMISIVDFKEAPRLFNIFLLIIVAMVATYFYYILYINCKLDRLNNIKNRILQEELIDSHSIKLEYIGIQDMFKFSNWINVFRSVYRVSLLAIIIILIVYAFTLAVPLINGEHEINQANLICENSTLIFKNPINEKDPTSYNESVTRLGYIMEGKFVLKNSDNSKYTAIIEPDNVYWRLYKEDDLNTVVACGNSKLNVVKLSPGEDITYSIMHPYHIDKDDIRGYVINVELGYSDKTKYTEVLMLESSGIAN